MSEVVDRLVALADPERAAGMARFFQTGPGQYGEGDVFLGLTVPQVTAVAKQHLGLPVGDLEDLLEDERHEVRLLALKIMALAVRRRADVGGASSRSCSTSTCGGPTA